MNTKTPAGFVVGENQDDSLGTVGMWQQYTWRREKLFATVPESL